MSTMKILSLLILLTLVIAATVHGDGIPVAPDFKGVTVETFTIALNKEQVAQVERLRKVTLTNTQMAPIWAIYTKIPSTIEVVSSRWDSCTCEFDMYAIWCRPGEIEIPRYQIASKKELDAYKDAHPAPEDEPEEAPDTNRYDVRQFILDSAGKIYRDGKELPESEIQASIEVLYERRKQIDRLHCRIRLDIPPPIDDSTDTRIRALVDRVKSRCDGRNISFWAVGLSAE